MAAATAVLAAALVVGDSVRDRLRHLALDRLQRIDEVLAVPRFFRAQLASDLSDQPEFQEYFSAAVPVAMLEGTVEDPNTHRRATHTNILGIDDRFAELANDNAHDFTAPPENEVILNDALAEDLGLAVGGECIVRLPVAREVPADSGARPQDGNGHQPASDGAAHRAGRRVGTFRMRPESIRPARRVFEPGRHSKSAQAAQQGERAARRRRVSNASPAELKTAHAATASDICTPICATDYGLTVRQAPLGYFLLESDRMLFEPAVLEAAEKAFGPLGASHVHLSGQHALGP